MDHGICPACKADLNGELIWETLRHRLGDMEATRVAQSFYGATRTEGRWGRQIAIYDQERDRTVAYRCPDCNHEWRA